MYDEKKRNHEQCVVPFLIGITRHINARGGSGGDKIDCTSIMILSRGALKWQEGAKADMKLV